MEYFCFSKEENKSISLFGKWGKIFFKILFFYKKIMNGISDKNAACLVSLKKTYTIGGEEITLETGKLGLLINGAVTISDTNDNILFVTTGFKTKGLNENGN